MLRSRLDVTRRSMRLLCALGATAALAGSAATAHAHGGIPRAFTVLMQPGNPDHILLRSDVWGLMHSVDGGKSWQWSCAEAYGGNSLSAQHLPMLITRTGRTLIANTFDGLQMTSDYCNFSRAASLGEELVQDVAASGDDLFVLTATGTNGSIRGQLWHSADDGDSWAVQGADLPTDYIGTSLRVAPSDPKRIYIAGRVIGEGTAALERSTDGGATWEQVALPIDAPGTSLRLQMVHATRPDVALLWVDAGEDLGQDSADQIWATADGGDTWKQIFGSVGDLPGLAVSPDGATVVVAGPKVGVQSAALDAAIANGPSAFEQVFTIGVWGLHWTEDGLYAGNDNFTAKGIPAYMLGVSKDGGHTFESLMNLCQVEYGSCAEDSTHGKACSNIWNMQGGFDQDFIQGERCMPKAADAGGGGATAAPPAASDSSGGCTVSTASSSGDGVPGLALAAVAFSVAAAARRRIRRR